MKRLFTIAGASATLLMATSIAFGSNPPPTSTTLTLIPSGTVPQFSAASARVAVTSGGSPVTTGTVKLFQTKTAGIPGSCATQNGNAAVQPPLSATPDSNGTATFDLAAAGLTGAVGTFGFIAKFTDPGNFDNSSSACVDLTVTIGDGGPETCPAGQNATISATFVNSPGFPLPGSYTWNLLLSVHACKNLTAVSAQGGKNAWTGAAFGAPSAGSVSLRKGTGGNNDVSVWTIGAMTSGSTVTLPVSVSGTIKPKTACGTVLGLIGSWSALSTSTEFGSQKSLYTGSSTVTVGPDPCF